MKETNNSDCFVVDGKLALPYTYFVGRVGSKFLTTIRDEKKIMGIKCNSCNTVYIPPRQNCDVCMVDIKDNWVDVKDTGEITNFTIVRYEDKHLPKKPPYILAMIKLEGADSPMAHIVEGVDLDKVKVGLKVKAVYAEEPVDTFLSIDHFEPV